MSQIVMPAHDESPPERHRGDEATRRRHRLNRCAIAVFGGLLLLILAVVGAYWLAATQRWRHASFDYSFSAGNLGQIGAALNMYAQVYGTFPPASVDDASGRPQTSWRTLLLPFFEIDRTAYNNYRFDRPWHDPANDISRRTPLEIYQSRFSRDVGTNRTSYVAVTSRRRTKANEQTAFPGSRDVTLNDVGDGVENTIVVVEIQNSDIEWAEPRDIDIDSLTADLKAPNSIDLQRGVLVSFADGHATRLPGDLTLAEFKALLTISGGETTRENLRPKRLRRD